MRPGIEPGLAEFPRLPVAAAHLQAELEVQHVVHWTQIHLHPGG